MFNGKISKRSKKFIYCPTMISYAVAKLSVYINVSLALLAFIT